MDAWISESAEADGPELSETVQVETEFGKWEPISYRPGLTPVIFWSAGEIF